MRSGAATLRALPVILVAALGACARLGFGEGPAPAPLGAPPPPAEAAAGPPVPYGVAIEGVDDRLRQLLRASANSVRLADQPAGSAEQLRRRAANDRAALEQVLRSQGYYDGTIEARVDTSAQPAVVTFAVQPGPQYRFAALAIEIEPADGPFRPPTPAALGLEAGGPARAQAVLDAEKALRRDARGAGYAVAELGERTAIVDHGTRTMDLTLRLRPGPLAAFGPLRVTGLRDVRASFVQELAPWQPGQRYDPAEIDLFRRRLTETRLFTLIRVTTPDELDAQGQLPVRVELTERKHRTVGAGVRYGTDEGPGANVFWENRNVFHAGRRLRLEADASQLQQLARATLRVPFFRRDDQNLLLSTEVKRQDTDAFDSLSASTGAALERQLTPELLGSIGLRWQLSRIKEETGRDSDRSETRTFSLVSAPVRALWDTSDDLLDPTRGHRLDVSVTPYRDILRNLQFLKGFAQASQYVRLSETPRVVVAGRLGLGSIVGAQRFDVPADERFFAGGGGTIRGYKFQSVGPRDQDEDPEGGLSIGYGSLELRTRITEKFGAVVFGDGGSAFQNRTFGGDDLRYAAGFGLRYFSPIGPVRADIGFPINRREDDDPFQLYLSIGQAF